jgi:hypothetical protein
MRGGESTSIQKGSKAFRYRLPGLDGSLLEIRRRKQLQNLARGPSIGPK